MRAWIVGLEKRSYFLSQSEYIFIAGQLHAREIMKNI